MTPDRWQQVKEVFSAASALPQEERRAFLDEACRGDDDLLAEVDSLLDAHTAENAIVDRPAAAHVTGELALVATDPWLGRRIGPYEIVALIGRGGMGEVYRARRVDAQFDKEVAIKLVPGGFHAAYVLQRLRAERQILANLEHPHIARLIDGGAADDGSPYLVMELVEGEPIDRYCAERRLSVRERLRLFRDVCTAVSYAHQHLVVHRDLKPGNILVTGDGSVKLLDFGIAKLLQPATPDSGTAPAVTIMQALTPGYSSPEQILGKPITTASDIYSLGVVLYVLLTGQSPYRRTLDTAEDAIREVCETEPRRPSTVAPTAEGALREPLGRDLDAIILQALRKEPERRYPSVDLFSEDIRRHLDGLPVLARGDQFGYRAGKFVRRHRFEVAAAALLIVTLAGATVISVREAREAEAQRVRAERHFASVRGLANTFMFEVHDAIEDLPGATRARGVLVGTALKYLDTLSKEAGTDAGLRLELAAAFEKVANMQGQAYGASKGDARAALQSSAKAISLLEPIVAAEPRNMTAVRALARVSMMKSRLLLLQGSTAEAVAGSKRAIALLEPIVQSRPDVETQSELAAAMIVHGHNLFYSGAPKAERQVYTRRSVEILEDLVRKDPDNLELTQDLGSAYSMLANTLAGPEPDSDALKEALALLRKALAIDERLVAETDSQDVDYLRSLYADRHNVALNLYEQGDIRGALENLRAAKRVLPIRAADPDDQQVQLDTVLSGWQEGRLLLALGNEREAEKTLVANLEAIRALGIEVENLQVVYVHAATEYCLGDLESRRASRPGISRTLQLQHWNQARSRFEQAIPRFERVTSAVTLDYMDMRPILESRAGLARSQAEIAKLK